jgi:hypothetical protein
LATEFTITGVTVSGSFPEAFTFAGLSAPITGTLPSFSAAPVVFVRNKSTKRDLFVDRTSVTTSGFNIDAGDVFDEDPPYTVDIGIITTDVTAAGAGVATAVGYPYYCSVQDVEDILFQLERSLTALDASSYDLDKNRLTRYISQATARVNGTISRVGYTVPAANTTKQVITNSLTASTAAAEEKRTLNQVEDGSVFSAGKTVRIHGTSGNSYNDEFTEVVAVDGDLVDVLYLKNSYDALSTVELCVQGMLTLREITANGAALMAIGGITVGFGTSENSKTDRLTNSFESDLQAILKGEIYLFGIARAAQVSTYVYENSTNLRNSGKPIFDDSQYGIRF